MELRKLLWCILFLLIVPVFTFKTEKFIDWAAKERGTECRDKCFSTTDYATGFCTAIASFTATSACALFNIREPLICGLIEGPFGGLTAFCGWGFLETVCEVCEEAYGIKDLLIMSEKNRQISTELESRLQNLTRAVKEVNQEVHASLLNVTTMLESSIFRLVHVVRYEKILTRIRFLSFLFSRMTSENLNPNEELTLKSHFITTASDTAYQDGVISLLKALHGLLIGQGLSIYGNSWPSILSLDETLCESNALMELDRAILSLFTQINYVYNLKDYSKQDVKELQIWMKSLRQEQLDKIRNVCKK